MRRVLILNVLLLAVIAALVVQIVALWWRTDDAAEQVAPREAKAQRLDVPNAVRPPPPSDLAASIADKDLFEASRSGAPEGRTAVIEAPVLATNLTLLGVRIVGGEREALVKDAAQPKALWVRVGEEVGGYTVERIEPTSIVLDAPSGDEMSLFINVAVDPARRGAPMGPAGVPPTPMVQVRPMPGATPAIAGRTPAPDIKAKIERLREEARMRRERARR
jgi:hypothetical protein